MFTALLYRISGELRPLPLRGTHDLAGILAAHRAKVARAGAALHAFGDKPLEERFELMEREEERAEEERCQ